MLDVVAYPRRCARMKLHARVLPISSRISSAKDHPFVSSREILYVRVTREGFALCIIIDSHRLYNRITISINHVCQKIHDARVTSGFLYMKHYIRICETNTFTSTLRSLVLIK